MIHPNIRKVIFSLTILSFAVVSANCADAQSSLRIIPNNPLRWLGAGHSPGYHKCNPGYETSYYNPYSHHNSALIQHNDSNANFYSPSFSTKTPQGTPQQNLFRPGQSNRPNSGILFGGFRSIPTPTIQTAPVPPIVPNPPNQVAPPQQQKSPSDENPYSREDNRGKRQADPDDTTRFSAPRNRRLAILRQRH